MHTSPTTSNESSVDIRGGGASFVGRDAVHLFRVITLTSAIRMHMKIGMVPTRGMTIGKMFVIAKEYTGKAYKRGQHQAAINDLQVWIDTMKAAIPTTINGEVV